MAVGTKYALMGAGSANLAIAHTLLCMKSRFPQRATAASACSTFKCSPFHTSVLKKGEQFLLGVQKRYLSKDRSCRLVVSNSSLSSTISSMAGVTHKKQVLLPIAHGTEEMEAVILADVLRRAGADVTIASVEDHLQILASREVKLVADQSISSCEGHKYDLIVLPGGMPGATRLRDTPALQKLVQGQAERKRLYAAVCAAPVVALQTWGLLDGLKATCHPGFVEQLTNKEAVESRVVHEGLVTTSRGPGTCFEFSLSLVEQLYGKAKMNEIAKTLILLPPDGTPSAEEYHPVKWKGKDASKPFRVLVPIADGTEEMEAVIIIDVLRRAGFDVVVSSVGKDLQIVAARKVKIVADSLIHDVVTSDFDAIVLPGGMPGAEHLRHSVSLAKLLHRQADSQKIIGAICASPAVVLEPKGYLKGKKATVFPSLSKDLSDQSAVHARVVIDGHLITSQGPGTAMEFALSIVEKVLGSEKASSMASAMVLPYSEVLLKHAVH